MSEFVINNSTIYMRYRPELLSVLPHANIMNMPEGKVLAIPHAADEVKVLRNMGFDIGAAILHEYDWCGGKPFSTQTMTSAFITQNHRCFVTSGMGVGKTAAVLYAYDFMKKRSLINKMLVVAPMSTMNPTWRREVLLRTPHLRVQVLYGTKEQRLAALALPADIYVINHDGVAVIEDALSKRLDIDMVCLDELTAFKNARANRSKTIQRLCVKMKRVVGLTGTPASNDIMDAYGQMKAILGVKFRNTFTSVREMLCVRAGPYKWIPRPEAVGVLAKMYQPNIRFTRDDTYDLPPCSTITRETSLTVSQTKLLKELRTEGAAIIEREGKIIGVNEAALLGKMLQVVLGGVYADNSKVIKIDASPRYGELMEILEQLDGRAIIFSTYKESVRQLAEMVGSVYNIGVINGDVPSKERDEIFAKFQGGGLDHIIAHPQTMSHGLTLTEASTIIWFGPPSSLEIYDQANARITRMGQKKNQLIVHLVASELERKIYRRLEKKSSVQGVLLDLLGDSEST